MIDEATLLECLKESAGRCALGPRYDAGSVRWVLERAAAHHDRGAVRALVVRDDSRAIAGWFIYHARHGGPG